MKKFAIIITALILMTGAAMAQTTDLIISEYIEGSSYNKAVEIYNGTSDLIHLGDYSLLLYANGNSSPNYTMAFDAVDLNPGETFVLVHSSASAELLALGNQVTGSLSYNGDDALVLVKNDEAIDSLGTVGFDPGSAWVCDEGSTQNHTMIRKPEVCNGDTNSGDDFDVCMEWGFAPVDSFADLGQHSSDCASVAIDTGSWDSLKAIYR